MKRKLFRLFLFALIPVWLFSDTSSIDSFIDRLYVNILNRSADKEGREYWRGEFEKGKTALEVAKFFYESKEFKELNITDEEFIRRNYKTFFDREPDKEGEAYWLREIRENHLLREQVFYGFSMSEEFQKVCKSYGVKAFDKKDQLYAFIERFYNYILQRSYDYEGREFWFEKLQNGDKTPADIVKSFFFSKEFLDKKTSDSEFVKIAYRTILNREPDKAGEEFWTNKLKKSSREEILNAFLASEEFSKLSEKFLGDEKSHEPSYAYDDRAEYKGLKIYAKNLSFKEYKLEMMDDASFNSLNEKDKLIVADKLLSTLFFGMPYYDLKELIDSSSFISTVWGWLKVERNDLGEMEDLMANESLFEHPSWGRSEVYRILERFFVLKKLDKHYLNFWSAYVLTQTIMFSPAYELASSHNPNITRVYTRLVRCFRDGNSLGYTTFLHMISEDNWRRFRSPEDNGREMLEIFAGDYDDAHVPIAALALKNWKLDRDYDTLVIGLDENRKPLSLFNTTIYNGFDFYRELAKSEAFVKTVTKRMVDFYFPTFSKSAKDRIASKIVSSKPRTWQDILLQIVFSKEYLLHSDRLKSAEENFFSFAKKSYYKHDRMWFVRFANYLDDMGQSSMKYKLGKGSEVPLDTKSFMSYHKVLREEIFLANVSEKDLNNYDWGRNGWVQKEFLSEDKFRGIMFNENKKFVDRLVDYLFLTVVAREADDEEKALFENHMLKDNGKFRSDFKLYDLDGRVRAAILVMDYLSRLKEAYRYKRVGDE